MCGLRGCLMATDIELAIQLIQAKNRQIPGVGLVPDLSGYLASLQDGQLPYVITWPGPGRWNNKGHGWWEDHRTFIIVCYVLPLGQQLIGLRAVKAVQFLQAMRAFYITAANIPLAEPTLANGGYQITVESGQGTPHSDEGLRSDLDMAGTPYHGFMLNLNVCIRSQPSPT